MIKSQFFSKLSDFIFKEVSQRLNQFKVNVLGKTAYVMMALDNSRCF